MDLVRKWQEAIQNPFLQNLPYKIESNKFGQLLMSSNPNSKGILKFNIAKKIDQNKIGGLVGFSNSVLTSEGVRVADVAWASDEFYAEFGDKTPYPKAPEICVEIKSPANSKGEMEEKVRLYLEKGAQEVWIVDEKSKTTFYSHTGKMKKSKLVEDFKL
jgi:Uma2 family endonuclease